MIDTTKNGMIETIIENMTLDDMCGQLLCYLVPDGPDSSAFSDFEEALKRTKPGGLFVRSLLTGEKRKMVTELANKYAPVPVIIAGDTEFGPNTIQKECPHLLPNQMAWGSCNDEKLVERGGKVTAQICRKSGIHWSFAPVVDINYNKDNPVTNTRAVSDSPEHVVKIAGAYLKGLQSEGHMAAACKHFPGDGMDDRNQHFCTSVNSMSKEEWMNTYGYVYKELFKLNPASIMIGHISAPALQDEEEYDEVAGYLPGTLSKSLMTKLLREELGFDGCIVSDALGMVGVAAVIPQAKLPVEFINAGGDMLLFAEPSYFDCIKNAVLDGTIPMDRLKDAVRRILRLKEFVGLIGDERPEVEITEDIEAVATEIAEKSIKIVRDADNILPLSLNKGDSVLLCSQFFKESNADKFEHIEKELNRRGIKTIHLKNPKHREIEQILDEEKPACVLINCSFSISDSSGGTLRMGWNSCSTFWRGLVLHRHPKVVFTSFGDPYKLYELPFLRTYVNTFSDTEESQKAFVRVLLGEIEAKGKNPVALKGFFEREV